MTFKKIRTTAVVSASIAAGSLIPMASAANAGNWPQLREPARKFKGSARYFGAAAVARQCEQL